MTVPPIIPRNGAATLRNRVAGMARITLVPALTDLTLSPEQVAILHLYDIIADLAARLSDAEAQLGALGPLPDPVFATCRRPVPVDFASRRRVA